MKVCFPLSLTIDCALLASSGRTKFEDNVLLTTFLPASMATGSSVAQYFDSRYSRTKTGTLGPTFALRTKSLRTTFPAKTEVAFRSSSGMYQPHIEIATSTVRLVASSAPVAASSKQTSTDFWEISSEIITVTVFGSILLLSLSAIFSFTSPVASSNPYEALTGTDTHFLLALSSIRTFGGSNPNRLDSP